MISKKQDYLNAGKTLSQGRSFGLNMGGGGLKWTPSHAPS